MIKCFKGMHVARTEDIIDVQKCFLRNRKTEKFGRTVDR
jgi:hypothetical protein